MGSTRVVSAWALFMCLWACEKCMGSIGVPLCFLSNLTDGVLKIDTGGLADKGRTSHRDVAPDPMVAFQAEILSAF
eukprot:1162077-Pelagomonas_calceolata.AAC.6